MPRKRTTPPPTTKPVCKLTGTDGNIFALAGKASRTLKDAGHPDQAKALYAALFQCTSYSDALALIAEYVTIT